MAGYDPEGVIQDYVVFLIGALSQISDVYYYCDRKLRDGELNKLAGLVQWAGADRHGRYDFGSWQTLIGHIGWEKICSYDELILVNDSIYGPMVELADIFETMQKYDYDFWGITSSNQIQYHIQSYFMVFKTHILENMSFRNFWEKIEKFEDHKEFVRKYEIYLTNILLKFGYKIGSLIKTKNFDNPCCFPLSLIKYYNSPFIKIKCFTHPKINLCEDIIELIEYIKLNTVYNFEMIKNHLGKQLLDNIIINKHLYNSYIMLKIFCITFYSTGSHKIKFLFFDKKIISLRFSKKAINLLARYSLFRRKLDATLPHP